MQDGVTQVEQACSAKASEGHVSSEVWSSEEEEVKLAAKWRQTLGAELGANIVLCWAEPEHQELCAKSTGLWSVTGSRYYDSMHVLLEACILERFWLRICILLQHCASELA